MTTSYYTPPPNIDGERITLPPEEARHASQVLRAKAGDTIVCIDGAGGWYKVTLTEVNKRHVMGTVEERQREVGESEVDVTLAVGVLKNQKRFETLIEKACELGVKRIIPLQTQRGEKKGSLRMDRLGKILIAAMKQCGRTRLVSIDQMTSFNKLVQNDQGSGHQTTGLKLICHEQASFEDSLLDVLDTVEASDILIAIGPEGGFSEEEILHASEFGFKVVSLGKRRLRAETAAITACAAVSLKTS